MEKLTFTVFSRYTDAVTIIKLCIYKSGKKVIKVLENLDLETRFFTFDDII